MRGLRKRRRRKDAADKDKSKKLLHDRLLTEFVRVYPVSESDFIANGLTTRRWVVTRAPALAALLAPMRSCADRNARNVERGHDRI
jgi:hypothetical protein